MFCPECGANVKEGIEFCSSCGKKLRKARQEAPSTSPKKNLRWLIIPLALLILLFTGGFLYWKKIGVWPWIFLKLQPGRVKVLKTEKLPTETQGELKIERKLATIEQTLAQDKKASGQRVEVTVANPTDKSLKNARFVEVIPKEFAKSINEVIFSPQPRLILKEDPEALFEWEEIPKGGAEKIIYEMYKEATKPEEPIETQNVIEAFKKEIYEEKPKVDSVAERPKDFTSIAWIIKMINEGKANEFLNKEFYVHGVILQSAKLTIFEEPKVNAILSVFKLALSGLVKGLSQTEETVIGELTKAGADRPARFLSKDLKGIIGDLRSEDEVSTEVEGKQVKVFPYYLMYNWSLVGSPALESGQVFAGKIKLVQPEKNGMYHLEILPGFWYDNPQDYVSIYDLAPKISEYQKTNKKTTTIGQVKKVEEKDEAFWVRLWLNGNRTLQEGAAGKNGWTVWTALPKNFQPAPKELLVLTVSGQIKKADFDLPTEDDKNNRYYLEARDLTPSTPVIAESAKFAKFEEVSVEVTPKVSESKVEENLGNITNKDDFYFSDDQKKLLVKNSFVVRPSGTKEFFELYEHNRYSFIPNFVTTDSILHNYHLMFNYLLEQLEQQHFNGELKILNANMLFASLEQYNALRGTDWENATKRNAGFFTVGSKLLDPSVSIPDLVKEEVEKELALIEAHEGIAISPLMNMGNPNPEPLSAFKEDYSQYIPRGHYEKSELLQRYFKSMMWYGRMNFGFKDEDWLRSAVLITLALGQGENQKIWDKLYEPTCFFVGKSDDITFYQLKDLLEKTYGGGVSLPAVTSDKDKFASLMLATKNLPLPQINSMPIFQASIQPDREEEIRGFRFMGQRFTIDASIFQRLIDREVPQRMLPKGLDIPAAMSSNEALNILKSWDETKYENYEDNMAKMKGYIAGLSPEIWTQNLYWGWLYSLQPLTKEKSEGYPTFMRNLAWVRKELNTFLGSWTELKHDTILYAKQAYAELGGGPPEEKDDRGYVEPNVYVYSRLTSLLKMTKDGLQSRGLLSDKDKENLEKMEQLALSLKTISEKELNNVGLTNEEYDLIRSYGGQLEHFWRETLSEEKEISRADENPAALVADVATDPNGQVLEEATGNISNIFVVVPIDGSLRIAEGGVWSYYEFTWPLADRLTDSKWRELLNSDKAPELPTWTSEFVAK